MVDSVVCISDGTSFEGRFNNISNACVCNERVRKAVEADGVHTAPLALDITTSM